MAELTEDQKTIKTQADQVKALEADRATTINTVNTLKAQVEQKDADLATAAKTIETLTAQLGRKDADLDAAATVVTDLKNQLAQKAEGTVELPTIKVGGETYELVGGSFTYLQREITLDVLREEPKLAAELVKEQVGNLRKLPKTAKA